MAIRSRAYYRKQRAKHIRRKKNICLKEYGWSYYKHEGSYSKGKIHCSCWMCQRKTNNKHRKIAYTPLHDWKHSDLQKINKMEEEEKEYRKENFDEDFC